VRDPEAAGLIRPPALEMLPAALLPSRDGVCTTPVTKHSMHIDGCGPDCTCRRYGTRSNRWSRGGVHESIAHLAAAGCRHCQPRQARATAGWMLTAAILPCAPAECRAASVLRWLSHPLHCWLLWWVTRLLPGRPAHLRRRSGRATLMQRAAPSPPAWRQVAAALQGWSQAHSSSSPKDAHCKVSF
jgi:hypothetical protein